MSLAMSWRSGLLSIKTVANKRLKNTLKVEINPFCDGKRDTTRKYYVFNKIWGVELHIMYAYFVL